MKFSEFLASKVDAKAIVKIMWPERNKSATGNPADFKTEMSIMNANVFDFLVTQHDKSIINYDVIVWLTMSDVTML